MWNPTKILCVGLAWKTFSLDDPILLGRDVCEKNVIPDSTPNFADGSILDAAPQ